jgi:hypothetical protein
LTACINAAAAARAVFVDDVLTAAIPRLSRLEALGDQLDELTATLARYEVGHPERVRARSVLFGVLQGLRCAGVLIPEQVEAFTARMRQGIAEGWL